MFIVSNNPKNKLATVRDVGMIQTRIQEDLEQAILSFLKRNKLQPHQIGTLILGFNGDGEGDAYYHQLIKKHFATQSILTFKNLVGDYPTVSGFALWMASLSGSIPAQAIYRTGKSSSKIVLIYNHYQNEQHGFILVDKHGA